MPDSGGGRLRTAGQVCLILTGVAAILTFILSFFVEERRTRESEVRAWQKAIVFEIIAKASPKSVTFERIRDSYVSEASVYEQFDIPKNQLSRVATRRILLELISDRALVQKGNDSFAIDSVDPVGEEMIEKFGESFDVLFSAIEDKNLSDQLISIVGNNAGRYGRRELAEKLVEQSSISYVRASTFVHQAISSGIVYVDPGKNYRTFLITDVPDDRLYGTTSAR